MGIFRVRFPASPQMKKREDMKDKIIVCQECKQEFVWTAGEQGFYAEKKLSQPVRCPICRAMQQKASQDKFRGQVITD